MPVTEFVEAPPRVETLFQVTETLFKSCPGKADLDATVCNQLSPDGKCYVCFTNAPNAVFCTCMHGGICEECIVLALRQSRACSLCREPNLGYFTIESGEENAFKVLSQFNLSL